VKDWHVQLAANLLCGHWLLKVKVEVAEGAGGYEAVGLGVNGIAEVAAGLL
jgi:hypothetical protein